MGRAPIPFIAAGRYRSICRRVRRSGFGGNGRLPGSAPELNPDEGVWRYLKRVEMRNPVCADLAELRAEFAAAVGRLRGKPEALRACIREVGYA